MKKVFNFGGLILILTLFLASCGKDPKMEHDLTGLAQGKFSLRLGTMGSFEVITKATEDVAVEDFTVRVYGKTLKETVYDSTWLRYADMPAIITIPAGAYTIEAFNGEQKSGFNTPYYYGKKEFSVGIQELTDAQVTCMLACIKLSVEFTPLFLSNVTNPVCIIHQTEGVALEFDPAGNNGTGYIAAPTDSTLAVTIRGKYTEDGTEVDRTYFINSVGAKQWHKIKLSVNTSAGIENGGGMIKIDHSVDEKESTVLVPGSDDLIDNNGDSGSWDDEENPEEPEKPGEDEIPTITGSSFNGSPFSFDSPVIITDADQSNPITLDITLEASKGGIQHLYLSMSSTDKSLDDIFQNTMGATEGNPWDLANPESLNATATMTLKNLGILKEDDPIKGKNNYVFSIGGFMSLLTSPVEGATETYYDHFFKIKVVDGNGHEVQKTLTVRRKL